MRHLVLLLPVIALHPRVVDCDAVAIARAVATRHARARYHAAACVTKDEVLEATPHVAEVCDGVFQL